MVRHQPRPRSPWGACLLATVVLMAMLLLVPLPWWQTMWRSTRHAPRQTAPLAEAPAFELLEIAAPPVVEIVPSTTEPSSHEVPREPPDAAWWDRAWEVRVHADLRRGAAPAVADTTPWAALGALGLPTSLAEALTVPDSALAARVWELVWEDKVDLSRLADYFRAIGRGRAYADLRSREAAMFGEFLFETVPVTETGDDESPRSCRDRGCP